jgi:DNA-binding NtrC family response regulator
MERLIDEMLDGHIMLSEAVSEFEKIYIQKALDRNEAHVSNTAAILGIHRNTLSKRLANVSSNGRPAKKTARKLLPKRNK